MASDRVAISEIEQSVETFDLRDDHRIGSGNRPGLIDVSGRIGEGQRNMPDPRAVPDLYRLPVLLGQWSSSMSRSSTVTALLAPIVPPFRIQSTAASGSTEITWAKTSASILTMSQPVGRRSPGDRT